MKIVFIGQSISKMRDPLKRPKDPTPAFFGGGQNGMRLVDSVYCTFFFCSISSILSEFSLADQH